MIGFPLLLIPLAIYNIIAFLMRDVSFATPPPLFTVPLMSAPTGRCTLERCAADARHPAVALRGHQGRAPRRQVSHRPSAVAAGVRRRGSGIRVAAAIRHLDLLPADAARAGGFPVGDCAAYPAPGAAGSSPRFRAGPRERPTRRRNPVEFEPEPAPAPSRPVAEPVDRPEPKIGRDRRRPRCRPRGCSRAMVRSRRRIRRADLPLHGVFAISWCSPAAGVAPRPVKPLQPIKV